MKMLPAILVLLFGLPFSSRAQNAFEDSLHKVIAEHKDDGEVAKAYNTLAFEYSRKDLAKSRGFLNAAIIVGKKAANYKRLSSSYSQLVYLLHDIGKPDSAEYYINEVKKLYESSDESKKNDVGSNYYTVAALYYKRTGAFQKAIPFFEKAIELFTRMKDRQSTAGQLLNLGNTYLAIGNYKKATEEHLQSLKIFEQIDNKRGISFCYQSLGNSFTQLKQYNKAIIYVNKSIQLKTALKDRKGLGSAQSNLGNIYYGLGDYDKSIAHFTASLMIAREVNSLPDELLNYMDIAKAYKAKQEYKKAGEYFTQGKLMARQLKDSSSLAMIETELIALRNNANNTATEENKLKTNIEFLEERGDLNRHASGLKNMIDFYIANKEYDKALEYNNKYHAAIDSIENNDLQLQIKKMEELYTVEKKEQEITLLKKDQELSKARLQKQKQLQYGAILLFGLVVLSAFLLFNRYKMRQQMKQLKLRNQIAADLHDEVGSSLSSIHMLSQMAAQRNNDAGQTEILNRMGANAKETMDRMSDIIWTVKPGETESGSLKLRLERFAYEICNAKNIELEMSLDDIEKTKLSMDQRKNIWLICKEALNNAVKYSGTERLSMQASLTSKKLHIDIIDYGKGFDPTIVQKGNGVGNMQHRAKEMNAALHIRAGINKGTHIEVEVPVNNA